jgi:mono/diheme cytochrome c family protein
MLRQAALFAALLLCVRSATAADGLTFESDIRPIFKAHCFQCHGEAGEKEGGLDLRLRRFIAKGGESGAAFTAGKPDESLILERVRSGEMPPGEDKQLSAEEIALLEKWIAAGAPTKRAEPESVGDGPIFTEEERSYWAFQPVVRPPVPSVEDASRARTPIDFFLLAKSRVGFAPDADQRRLLRRAYFDLLGLAPTPDEVADFDSDSGQTEEDLAPKSGSALRAEDRATTPRSGVPHFAGHAAWEQLIDRLLASPHYGERWGRHWLDVAGYADSEGYTDEDRVRPHAWRYRDYVTRSFNDDKPFSEFIVEQLAGDELVAPPYKNLSPESQEKLTATGFLRMAPDGTASATNQAVATNQVVADTLQIVATSLLGLTVNCAQCHDHRYDPIPTRDYYRLRAIFEPALNPKNWQAPSARQITLYTDADRELAAKIEEGAKQVEADRAKKAAGYITRTLNEEVELVPENIREPLRKAYRAVAKDRTQEQKDLLAEYPSVDKISVGSLYLYDQRRDERASRIDAARKKKETSFVEATRQAELAKIPAETRDLVKAAFTLAVDKRSPEQKSLLEKHPGVLVTLATLKQFNPEAAAEIARDVATAKELRASKAAVDLKVFADRAAEIRATKPVEGFLRSATEVAGVVPSTFVFHRGDHEQPKAQVTPAGLSILPGNHEVSPVNLGLQTTGRRLSWARHLASGKHPLVARVIANRVWLHHFGRGLVNSPGDFGVLGDRPTHPALLDWLAAELVDSGWSVKRLHRLIMTSTVYRQSSRQTVSGDPENRFYSRYPVRRLESETLRDAVLVASGQLNPKLYGEPVPVMEDEVGRIVIGQENLDGERKPTKEIDLQGEQFRRSLYIQVRRTRTLSVFEAFDAPAMSPNCDKRSLSTVTPQSLMLMNSDFSLEYSDRFASRVIAEAEGIRGQITLAWTLAFADSPSVEDVSAAEQFVDQQRKTFAEQNPKLKPEEAHREALAVFCQALLSSNRFLYID